MNKRELLRKRIAEPGIILIPGVYDCLSAKIAERTGFEVIFTTGFGISGVSARLSRLWSINRY